MPSDSHARLYELDVTSDVRIMRACLVCLEITDIEHAAPTMGMIRWNRTISVGERNEVDWGNDGATAFLLANRVAYVQAFYRIIERFKFALKPSSYQIYRTRHTMVFSTINSMCTPQHDRSYPMAAKGPIIDTA